MTILNVIIGTATGIISGFGIGGGSILVLYLTTVTGMNQYTAGGINLLYFICCAPIAMIGHIKHRAVQWKVVVWCAIAGIAVATPTALLSPMIQSHWLRRLFGLMLIYIGIRELCTKPQKNDR